MEDNKNISRQENAQENMSSENNDLGQERSETVKEVIKDIENETYTTNNSMSLLEELELYVGPKKEAYYSTRFEDIIDSESKIGWNWPALFVPVLWMAYRKMYIESGILLVVSTALGLLTKKIGFLHVISLIITFLVPATANWLYFRHAKKDIEAISSRGEERKSEIIAKGGTSVAAVFVFLIISILISGVELMNNQELMNIIGKM